MKPISLAKKATSLSFSITKDTMVPAILQVLKARIFILTGASAA